MSLIYTALNALDADAGAQTAQAVGAPPPIVVQPQRSPLRWLLATLVVCVIVVAIGVVALMLLRGHYTPPPVAVAQPPLVPHPSMSVLPGTAALPVAPLAQPAAAALAQVPVATVDTNITPPPMASSRINLIAAPVINGATSPAPAGAATAPAMLNPNLPVAAAAAPAVLDASAAAIQPVAAPAAQKSIISVQRIAPPGAVLRAANGRTPRAGERSAGDAMHADAPSSAAIEADTTEADRLATSVQLAIDAGRMDDAAAQLRQLATRLPAESLTLLRLQAWYAMRSGDATRATAIYSQIVDRMPDDEPAAVNLAVLYWRAGQHAEARRVIAALAARRPDSESVRGYGAQFEEHP